MVLREIEFGCQDVSIASEPLDELSHIRFFAPECGVPKTRHSLSKLETQYFCIVKLGETAVFGNQSIFAPVAEKYFSSCKD